MSRPSNSGEEPRSRSSAASTAAEAAATSLLSFSIACVRTAGSEDLAWSINFLFLFFLRFLASARALELPPRVIMG
jgi:hypothetical protein